MAGAMEDSGRLPGSGKLSGSMIGHYGKFGAGWLTWGWPQAERIRLSGYGEIVHLQWNASTAVLDVLHGLLFLPRRSG